MDLSSYISDPERRATLAAETKSSPDYLWQIATKRRKASHTLAQKIEDATAKLGPERVTKESLRPDIWPDESPKQKHKRAA